MTISVGSPAPDVTLPDDEGRDVRLSIEWSKQSLVLLFVRHFG